MLAIESNHDQRNKLLIGAAVLLVGFLLTAAILHFMSPEQSVLPASTSKTKEAEAAKKTADAEAQKDTDTKDGSSTSSQSSKAASGSSGASGTTSSTSTSSAASSPSSPSTTTSMPNPSFSGGTTVDNDNKGPAGTSVDSSATKDVDLNTNLKADTSSLPKL